MEYIVGPVLALLISMKFTTYKCKECCKERVDADNLLEARIELVEARQTTTDNEMPKKIMATISPVAQAVQKLNQQVGI